MNRDNTLPPLPGDAQHTPQGPVALPQLQPVPPARAGPVARSETSHISVNPPFHIFTTEKSFYEDAETMSAQGSTSPDRRPLVPRQGTLPRRARTADTHMSARRSGLDYIVPVEEKTEPPPPTVQLPTISDRINVTIQAAKVEKAKYAMKARFKKYAINVALGLQITIGAMTTALPAVTKGKQTSVAVSVLGGLTTIVASYLARVRSSNEPELSLARCKDLEQFIREAEAFEMDNRSSAGSILEHSRLNGFRTRFEELLRSATKEGTKQSQVQAKV